MNLLLAENFVGEAAKAWELEPGWRIEQEVHQRVLRGEGHHWARLRGGEDWTDYSMRVRLNLLEGGIHLCYRVSEAGRYFLSLQADKVDLRKEAPWGEFFDLAQSEVGPELGAWHDVEIAGQGGLIRVYLDGFLLISFSDPEPLLSGTVAFETLKGSRAAIAEVKIVPTMDILPDERIMYVSLTEESLRGWELSEGVQVVSEDGVRMLQMSGKTEAVWKRVHAEHFTLAFRFLPGRGKGGISFQRSGGACHSREYRLQMEGGLLVLNRMNGLHACRLGAIELRVGEKCEWYDICVHVSRGRIRAVVDGSLVLISDDLDPLPLGNLAFNSWGKERVAYAGIRFLPWESMNVERIRRQVDDELNIIRLSQKPEKVDPQTPIAKLEKVPTAKFPAAPGPFFPVIPLQLNVYNAQKTAYTINPGPIPPNFMHTWALDIKGITSFKLESGNIVLDWQGGDRITVFDSANNTLQTFSSLVDVQKKTITPKATPYDQGQTHQRIYLQLETSPSYIQRRFVLTDLVITAPITGMEEALVVADTINYDDKNYGPITATLNSAGCKIKLYSPWKTWQSLSGSTWPKPEPKDGWYQIGQYLDTGQGFFTLSYYNEHESLLRLYLYNYALPEATKYCIKLALMGRSLKTDPKGKLLDQFEALKGAFFSLDPNPNNWDSATIPVSKWSPQTWTMIEVPMLYPMAEKLPAASVSTAPGKPAYYYRSIYEEKLNNHNIVLRIELQSFLEGDLKADFVGQAIGKAIQEINSSGGPSAIDLAKGAWDAISTGKDWYDKGEKFYDGAKQFYEDEKKKGGPALTDISFNLLGGLVSLGAAAWGGIVGLAGAAITMLAKFLFATDPEPLQLSLQMSLRGLIKGSASIQYQSRYCCLYLPGRFSINEAFCEGLPIDDLQVIASYIPRYDRTLGHFGFQYSPENIKLRVIRWDLEPGDILANFVFPTVANPSPGWLTKSGGLDWGAYSCKVVDRALPILYNPFAEIIPMAPIVVSTNMQWNNLSKQYPACAKQGWWLQNQWIFDVSWKTHVVPEPDDLNFPHNVTLHRYDGPQMYLKVFLSQEIGIEAGLYVIGVSLPEGLLLQVMPKNSYVPSTFQHFSEIKNVEVHNWYDPLIYIFKDGKPVSLSNSDPFPLHDVMYYWDIPYFYYGRSRKTNGVVPSATGIARLRAPVTIDMTGYKFNKVWNTFDPPQRYDLKSRLLLT